METDPLAGNVWDSYADICAYCPVQVSSVQRRCARCGNALVVRQFRYAQPSSHLHVMWVLLAGLGQLYVVHGVVDYMTGETFSVILLHGALASVAFVLATGLYFRQLWAYVSSIVILVLLLGLAGMNAMGLVEGFLPQAPQPESEGLTPSFVVLLQDALLALELMAMGLALLWAVLLAGPDFTRDEKRLVARLDRGRHTDADYYVIGRRLAQQGLWASAVLHWRRAVALSPDNYAYLRELGRGYGQLGYFDRSFANLELARAKCHDLEARADIVRIATEMREVAARQGAVSR